MPPFSSCHPEASSCRRRRLNAPTRCVAGECHNVALWVNATIGRQKVRRGASEWMGSFPLHKTSIFSTSDQISDCFFFFCFFFSTHAFLAALSGILMRIQLRNTANITFFFSSHRFPCPVEALSSGQTFKTLSSHGQQNKPHHPSATGNQSPDNPNISPDPFPSTLLLGYSPNSNLPRRLQHPAGATGIGFLRPLPVICR
jgi:hypothetical protein